MHWGGAILAACTLASCGRVGFDLGSDSATDGVDAISTVCTLSPLAEPFAADISAWNAVANEDRIDEITTFLAQSCGPDLDVIAALLPARGGTPGTVTETDLDWAGAQTSFFLSPSRSSYGPMLANHIDTFVGGATDAGVRDILDRRGGDDWYRRLVVFAAATGRVAVVDGREHD